MDIYVYTKAALKYKPDKTKTLFIAESPPFKREGEELRYFYFEKVSGKDFLFRCTMEVLFPEEYEVYKTSKDKAPLLTKFRDNGYFLIDAVDYPINQEDDRDFFVNKGYPNLVNRLKDLIDKETKIILVKKNIFELLTGKLKSIGYNVINTEHLDFPGSGNQLKYKSKLSKLLKLDKD